MTNQIQISNMIVDEAWEAGKADLPDRGIQHGIRWDQSALRVAIEHALNHALEEGIVVLPNKEEGYKRAHNTGLSDPPGREFTPESLGGQKITRIPTPWMVLANEVKRLEEIANYFAIGNEELQRYVAIASQVADLIIEASERR